MRLEYAVVWIQWTYAVDKLLDFLDSQVVFPCALIMVILQWNFPAINFPQVYESYYIYLKKATFSQQNMQSPLKDMQFNK